LVEPEDPLGVRVRHSRLVSGSQRRGPDELDLMLGRLEMGVIDVLPSHRPLPWCSLRPGQGHGPVRRTGCRRRAEQVLARDGPLSGEVHAAPQVHATLALAAATALAGGGRIEADAWHEVAGTKFADFRHLFPR
jgi:hypothetical protein